jgi:hypothetical protein
MNKIILEEIKRFKEILKESKSNVLISPLEGPLFVTSPFEAVRSYEVHPGVDLRARDRENVMSPLNGVVKVANMNHNKMCGGTIIIEHPYGFRSGFCHMSRIDVKQGDQLTQGQIVGLSGGDINDPGRGNSKNRHLHWTLKKDGKLVNPMKYVDQTVGPEIYDDESQTTTTSPESKDKISTGNTEEEALLKKILDSEYLGMKVQDWLEVSKDPSKLIEFVFKMLDF